MSSALKNFTCFSCSSVKIRRGAWKIGPTGISLPVWGPNTGI